MNKYSLYLWEKNLELAVCATDFTNDGVAYPHTIIRFNVLMFDSMILDDYEPDVMDVAYCEVQITDGDMPIYIDDTNDSFRLIKKDTPLERNLRKFIRLYVETLHNNLTEVLEEEVEI